MAIGIGIGLPFNKRSSYPTVGLGIIVYFNSTYEDGGITYIQTSKGIGLPVISGTGLNRIIDFSPLSDVRFDKGSYVGNAYGLPETYNYPYVGIYYDATSEATRYYWKPTDFAYAVILKQSLLVDNMFFLKATATTDTSNIIATVDRLFIYSTALADNNLAKIKTYIGIQDDFYGENIIPIASSEFSTNGVSYWASLRGTLQWDSVNKNIILTSDGTAGTLTILRNSLLTIGKTYLLQTDAKSPNTTERLYISGDGGVNPCTLNNLSTVYQTFSCDITALATGNVRFFLNNITPTDGKIVIFDNIKIRLKYVNYYLA